MYYLYLLGRKLALTLSRNSAYTLAKFISLAQFYLSRKDRETILYNLIPIIEDKKEREKCAKEVFINFGYYLADFFRYSKINHDFIKKYVKVSGLENVEEALRQGRGVVALTAHLGNYELAGAVTSLLGYPVSVVALPHRDKRVNNFFDSQRQMVGLDVISTGAAIKGCLSALKKGKILALLGDRDFAQAGIKLTMFSRKAYFPRGGAFFAHKTKALIVPGFLVREDKFFYHLIFDKPIECDNQDEAAITSRYLAILEKYIKKYPGQWYIFQKLWID
jgi:KDO2-lipid IV(A) lauroyltransferase